MISRKESSVKSPKTSEERIFHELNELEEISGVYQRYDVENGDVILTLTSSLHIQSPSYNTENTTLVNVWHKESEFCESTIGLWSVDMSSKAQVAECTLCRLCEAPLYPLGRKRRLLLAVDLLEEV